MTTNKYPRHGEAWTEKQLDDVTEELRERVRFSPMSGVAASALDFVRNKMAPAKGKATNGSKAPKD